ncbi:MAG TPA: hypothetical protein VJB94_02460 [Candidatus Nanoarchaeia archaeon]|nr:hypothetical protein [Candidatus Nanoarchaeia archaeon]
MIENVVKQILNIAEVISTGLKLDVIKEDPDDNKISERFLYSLKQAT